MTAEKKGSRSPGEKSDGKKKLGSGPGSKKKTAKYTLWRSGEDVKNLEKVRKHLEKDSWGKEYKTDSKIYKLLPAAFLNAVETIASKDQLIEKLTAKEENLEEIRSCICRINELVKK